MVVIFVDGNIGNIQALYLLLSRPDIQIHGIVVDTGICSLEIGTINVLQLVRFMKRYDIQVYRGTPALYSPNEDNLEFCNDIELHNLYGDINIYSHEDLMQVYRGDAISLGPLSTVSQWIQNGSITSITGFVGSTIQGGVGYHIYSIDPDAYNYVIGSNVQRFFWTLDMIPQGLSSALRGITLSNDVLQSISRTVIPTIIEGKWRFWDMVVVMNYLQYI